jgi:subtilisin family serine protease
MKSAYLMALALICALFARGAEPLTYLRLQYDPEAPIEASGGLAKLSPDLRAAVALDATIAGMDESGIVLAVHRPPGRDALEWSQALRLDPRLPKTLKSLEPAVPPSNLKVTELLLRLNISEAFDQIHGFRVKRLDSKRRLAVVELLPDTRRQVILALAADPKIEAIEANYLYTLRDGSRDVASNAAVGRSNPSPDFFEKGEQWAPVLANTRQLWSLPASRPIKVALIDTGVASGHEDLGGNVLEGFSYVEGAPTAADDNGHGTHCAGIIAALHNGFGIHGVTNNVCILPIKAFSKNGTQSRADVVLQALYCAIDQQVDIISMSAGSDSPSEELLRAVRAALEAGIIMVVSAGNGYGPLRANYPAMYRETGLIVVMSVDKWGRPSAFNSFSKTYVHLAAPGENIISTWSTPELKYEYDSGTSMAAPHVSGVIAALIQLMPRGTEESPQAYSRRITSRLLTLVQRTPELEQLCETGGYLRLPDYFVSTYLPNPTVPDTSQSLPTVSPAADPAARPVTLSGVLLIGGFSIDNERSSTVLKTPQGEVEVYGARDSLEAQLRKLGGKTVRLKGVMEKRPGVALSSREMLRVDQIVGAE